MDWADELAASVSGPQVVNDSKTPSGTVHVGSLRGPVILDTITRALRARGLETTLLYGVDDLDPMDAQALLTPDAIDHEMGRPLAHVPDQAGDGHASYARHHAQAFIDTFAGLGIRPDRYYWMSDIYPTGAMDPFIRTALDRADRVREIYRRVANVQHPDEWHPFQVICEVCGKVGTTIVTRWDGERVFYECRPDLVTWARGCGHSGLDLALRRDRQARLEPRMGRPVEPVRGDHRAVRQGPLDGRRLARSLRRHRPRGLRARAAAQRALRVPEHRRPEDVDLEGPRRGRPPDRRGRPPGAAPAALPAAPTAIARSSSTPRGPTRSRASSTSSTSSPTRRPAARSRAPCRRRPSGSSPTPRCRPIRPSSPSGRAPSGCRSRTSPGSSSRTAWTSAAVAAADKRAAPRAPVETEHPRRAGRRGAGLARDLRARDGPGAAGRADPAAGRRRARRRPAGVPGRPRRRRAGAARRRPTTADWQDLIFRRPRSPGRRTRRGRLEPRGLRRDLPAPSTACRRDRGPGGSWPPSPATFVDRAAPRRRPRRGAR